MKEKRDTRDLIRAKVDTAIHEKTVEELAIGFLRYEALRKLNPPKFTELHWRNIKGERFDDMVDALVVENL